MFNVATALEAAILLLIYGRDLLESAPNSLASKLMPYIVVFNAFFIFIYRRVFIYGLEKGTRNEKNLSKVYLQHFIATGLNCSDDKRCI